MGLQTGYNVQTASRAATKQSARGKCCGISAHATIAHLLAALYASESELDRGVTEYDLVDGGKLQRFNSITPLGFA